jgi:hypothetical protein
MSVTVYGCIKWSESPPEIFFENLETCLVQSACIHWTGEHAKQVALTLSGADNEACNDTFYSTCIEWGSSKKFKISIPEDCCITAEECRYCGEESTPTIVKVTIRDVEICYNTCVAYTKKIVSTTGSPPINGEHYLPQVGSCLWQIYIENWATIYRYSSYPCLGSPTSYPGHLWMYVVRQENYASFHISIEPTANGLALFGSPPDPYCSGDPYAYTPSSGCVDKSLTNGIIECLLECDGVGYGGTAVIEGIS